MFSLWYFIAYGAILLYASAADIKSRIVPDRVHIAICLLAAVSAAAGYGPSPAGRLAGCFLCGGFLLLLSLATHGGIGGGDIKLLAASGLLLGFPRTCFSLFLAYILALLWYLPALLLKRASLKYEAPMVPFFSAALLISALWGDRILLWYLRLFF